jgi:hypothetical protein
MVKVFEHLPFSFSNANGANTGKTNEINGF